MPDREKVIGHLNDCMEASRRDNTWVFVRKDVVEDTISLLKEQEPKPVRPVRLYGKDDWYGLVCVCPDCKAEWMSDKSDTHFCPNCGQEVKWND